MRRSVVMVAVLARAAGAVAEIPSSESWQSTGPFKISPTANRCIASSTFKRGKQDLVMALESHPPGAYFQIRVYAPGTLRRWDSGRFSLGNAKLESDLVMARSSKPAGTIFYLLGANRQELVAAGPNPELTMQQVQSPGDIRVSGLGAALALVDACSADLLEKWGYSKEFQRQLATAPKLKKEWTSYVSPYDFPQSAIAAVKGGETHVLVDVDIDGRASNCRVILSSGREDIDRTTCVIVAERAKYQPAQNVKGEPIASPFYATFRWEIPGL